MAKGLFDFLREDGYEISAPVKGYKITVGGNLAYTIGTRAEAERKWDKAIGDAADLAWRTKNPVAVEMVGPRGLAWRFEARY